MARQKISKSQIPIVGSKLAPPRSPVQAIPRSRLSLGGVENLARLTLVKGPAGSGKTIVLAQWHRALEKAGVDVAWLTLDSADNTADRLSAYLAAALRRTAGATAALSMSGERIFEDLARRHDQRKPLVLILDDLEGITSDEAVNLLQGLVRQTGPSFSIIAAGRAIPAMGQARLVLDGGVRDVTSANLKFDDTEVCAMLSSRLGARISTDEAIRLGERLDGWAAGLQFACLALQNKADIAGFANHAAAQGAIADYLRDDVFNRLPEDVRDFLRHIAIFPVLTADLCDAITNRQDSAAVLASLEEAGLFLSRVDLDHNVAGYRFHDVFGEFLRGQLALLGASHVATVHRAASGWYAAQGRWLEAIEFAMRGGDRDNALSLLESVAMDYVGWGDLETLLIWNSRITIDEAIRYPHAFASWLWAKVFAGHHKLVSECLAQFKDRLAEGPGLTPLLQDNFASIEILNDGAADRFDEVLAKGEMALPAMRRLNSFETTAMALLVATAQVAYGRLQDARRTLDISRRSSQLSDRSVNHAYLHVIDGTIAMTELRLPDAIAGLQLALENAVAERGPYSHAAGLCASSLCEALYEANRIADAEQVIEGRIHTVTKVGWSDCALNINLAAARIAALRRDFMFAGQILAEAQALSVQRDSPRMIATFQWEQAHLAHRAGDQKLSEQLVSQIVPTPATQFMTYVEAVTRDVMPIRFALARGECDGLSPRLVRLMAQAKNMGFRRRWLKLCILHAVCLAQLGRQDAALNEMISALRAGLPAGFIRSFLDEGDIAIDLVKQASNRPDISMRSLNSQMERLQAAIDNRPEGSSAKPVALQGSLRKQLTARELEIIDIAARGLTNGEIGECLALSEPTVKWHMQKAFRKLGVGNRTEAIFITRQ